jgi:hypothetical protein
LTEATTKPGPCQVGINAEDPCSRSAEVEILGVPFCEPCARTQEAYFAIGELTLGKHSFRSKPLAEVLERMRRERELTGCIIASKSTKGNRSVLDECAEKTASRSHPDGLGVGALPSSAE